MRRFFSLLLILGLLCGPAIAQDKPRAQKLPSPLTPEQTKAAKIQTKEIFNLFRDNCFTLAGDSDTIIGQILVSGMKESVVADPQKLREQNKKEIKNYKKYIHGNQIGLRLESTPWKCVVYGAGALEPAIIDGANNLYQQLYTDPAYSNLKVVNIPDTKDFDKTHSLITADREDGAYYKFRITYGGVGSDRVILSLEFTPPRQRETLTEYLAIKIGDEHMNLPAPQRNSKIAMLILEKACVEHFGDYAAISKWATLNLSENDEFIIDETRGTWFAEDKDVSIMLQAADDKKTVCKMSGSSVDADMIHRDFQEMLTAHVNEPGHSIAANQYSSIKYKDKPSEMPENMPYYSGGILRKDKQEIGIDIVLSTKRKDNEVNFTINVKPTKER